MAAPDKAGSKYVHTDQERDNSSHDDTWGVNVVELVGENSDGTALNRVLVNDDGSITVSGGSSGGAAKATDAYGVQAVSDDGTYKYFFFEDASKNYYIMRKHILNKVFTYTKGTGGYSTVYVSSSAGPSGSPTWDTYGATF